MAQTLRVAFAGTPEFAVAPLRAILASRHPLVGVLTQPDRPAGRGRQVAASPVKRVALAQGVPLAQPASLRSPEDRAALASWQVDVLVVVAYGLILPPEALALPRLGCVNIHASLLPRWRGAAPVQRAILAGDAITGVTIMQMDAGLDTGPILLAESVPIGPDTDTPQLQATLSALGARLIVEALDGLAAGTLVPRPQPQSGVTYAPKLTRAEARLDFARPAVELARAVRALRPWPGAETVCAGTLLKLHAAQPLADAAVPCAAAARAAARPPGTVLGIAASSAGPALAVLCGTGVLAIDRLQRAGRRVVTAEEFARTLPRDGVVLGAP
ncbi:MAG: methionyl-tRNA formyltransferase [Gammaproteobacteria bacterium]|nr:methionyl-tRNA formyltransferase [Gammaproteobacteria bacterium]